MLPGKWIKYLYVENGEVLATYSLVESELTLKDIPKTYASRNLTTAKQLFISLYKGYNIYRRLLKLYATLGRMNDTTRPGSKMAHDYVGEIIARFIVLSTAGKTPASRDLLAPGTIQGTKFNRSRLTGDEVKKLNKINRKYNNEGI